jgi:hypothetical protein
MPSAADLDDPLGFAQGEHRTQSDDDFDAALGELLDNDPGDAEPDTGADGPRE